MSNKVLKSSATVAFETSSGYESRAGKDNGVGTEGLEWALRETVRVMTINGDKEKVASIVAEVTAAVEEDLKG
jgi:hypothetical protein